MRSRLAFAAAVFVATAAGVGVGLLLTGGADRSSRTGGGAAATHGGGFAGERTGGTETRATRPRATAPSATTPPGSAGGRRRERAAAQLAATRFVEAVEQSDAAAACRLLGRSPSLGLEGCARAAGVDLRTLPTSNELNLGSPQISTATARIALGNGTTAVLRRSGGRWLVVALRR